LSTTSINSQLISWDFSVSHCSQCKAAVLIVSSFADFESCHIKPKYECGKCEKISEFDTKECPHQTLVKSVQVPTTCSYLILDIHGKVVFKNTFIGRDCARRFLLELLEIEPQLMETLSQHEELNMSARDEQEFLKATSCHICDELLLGDSVRGKFYSWQSRSLL
jgi:hypothetical protein